MALISSLLALRRDARILKIPPYLSALCLVVGIAWLLVLPLNDYSRNTYVSENALLPAQVHTYFAGSEHNVFRAYRHEVWGLRDTPVDQRSHALADLFRANGLKVATQNYHYRVSNRSIASQNVYAILQGPRADATEAIVLMAGWTNMHDDTNTSGVALVLTLARYFKRWSLWSKDIIFLVSGDSTTGPHAWVDAYHDAHDPRHVEPLQIKSGALQAAVAVDYPAGPWGHRYDKLHLLYDGVNGQLPNLDLFNTAVQIASNQMGIACAIQRILHHDDSYKDRLHTMLRGMLSQGLGHPTGPHSSFVPYHVDAITLMTVGDGWHDEMSLGKTIESLFRSLNNLLEHLHQSFFFYLLVQANRFISIGTYLPSVMLIAVNFTITSIALWIASGRSTAPMANPAATRNHDHADPAATPNDHAGPPEMQLLELDGAKTLVPKPSTAITERHLLFPLLAVLAMHLLGLLPLYLFNTWPASALPALYLTLANLTTLFPLLLAWLLAELRPLSAQENTLIQCFSLLLLGMILAALATLNFSQSFLVGLLAAPLSFVRRTRRAWLTGVQLLMLALLNPVMVAQWSATLLGADLKDILVLAAHGWAVAGLWTQLTVWLVWFPAWLCAAVVVAGGAVERA